MTPPDSVQHVRGFDVVIGNPPWGASIPDRVKPLIRHRLPSVASGTLDTFAAFTEHACETSRRAGVVGLVLPDILLLKNYPSVRLYLLENTSIEQLAHWGQVFPDANIDVCTLVTRCIPPLPNHVITCIPEVQESHPGKSVANRVANSVFLGNKEYRFNLRLSPQTQELLDGMRAMGPSVGSLFTIREGVHSGNVRAKLFLDRPDGSDCKPLIFGRDEIGPMRLRWSGKHIQLDEGRFDRAAGEYFNIGDPDLYARDKILVRRTGDFILSAIDLEGRFCSNNFFIVVPQQKMTTARLTYAAATLNTAFATLYFRTIQPRTGKLFAELKITHLEDIPLPFFATDWADAEGERLARADWSADDAEQTLREFEGRLVARIAEAFPVVAAALKEKPHE